MRVRLRTSLLFGPLFLVVVLVNGLYYLTAKKAEINWGLRETIQATAATIQAVLSQRGLVAGLEELNQALDLSEARYPERRFLLGLRLYRPQAGQSLLFWNPFAIKGLLETGSDLTNCVVDLRDPLAQVTNQRQVTRISLTTNGFVVTGIFDTTGLAEGMRDSWSGVMILTLASTILAVILAFYISRKIIKPLGEMRLAARALSTSERNLQTITPTAIREFDDLAETFEIVQEIVLGTLRSTQRRLIESEQLRSGDEYCEQLTARLQNSRLIRHENFWLGRCFLGSPSPGSFAARCANWIFCGLIKSSTADAALRALSLVELLRSVLKTGLESKTQLEDFLAIYPLAYFTLVEVKQSKIEIFRYENDELSTESRDYDQSGLVAVVSPLDQTTKLAHLISAGSTKGARGLIEDITLLFKDPETISLLAIEKD